LFIGSQQAGERAAVIMPLIESAKLDGHDPAAYLKDVFERLPTLKNADLHLLLPHLWTAPPATTVPNAASPAFAQAATPQHVAGDGARVGWPSAYRHLRPEFAKAMRAGPLRCRAHGR